MNEIEFNEHYTVDYLSNLMSLRTPQAKSLEILNEILEIVDLKKNENLDEALAKIKAHFQFCTNFERNFISITFALATGVGKTRLMGAFIAYLFARQGIKNFFVVAPNTTIYKKIRSDLEDESSPKYVFKGLKDFFAATPKIFSEDDYRNRQLNIDDEAGINIFLYNIDKFNKENAKMREENENLGESFFKYLSKIPDLVLIMDESHHYRAERGAAALNELNPILGLELTATPIFNKGAKQEQFQNVVYEYPLSKAIADGYTRTPYAMARTDTNFQNFGEDFLDELMLNDGIKYHEKVKLKLMLYADSNKKRLVKPFMLVVCQNTDHAAKIENFIKSPRFKNGEYANKVIKIDSKQKKSESEENIKLLQSVEDSNNPIEIVIHVNMLKEGWDVNNLYTIVPLRTAASKILREQMVGRGLRLPYGTRTGDKEIDSVMLTAHDKFDEIIEEAGRGDSIFNRGNLIKIEEDEEKFEPAQLNLNFGGKEEILEKTYESTGLEKTKENDEILTTAHEFIKNEVSNAIQNSSEHEITQEIKNKIVREVSEKISEEFQKNNDSLQKSFERMTDEIHEAAQKKFIPIPQVKIIHAGRDELIFKEFSIDTAQFNNVPPDDEIKIKELNNPGNVEIIQGEKIDLSDFSPVKVLMNELKNQPEVDYDKNAALLFNLINQVCSYFSNKFGAYGMKKIIWNDKIDIMNKIFEQMMQHIEKSQGEIREKITGVKKYNLQPPANYTKKYGLYDSFTGNIKSGNFLFTGIKKGVFDSAKFDSLDELKFARLMEEDKSVESWLKPADKEFNLRYNLDGEEHNYVPDFVAETGEKIYLIEIKGEHLINNPDVPEKEKAGIKFCKLASAWGASNGFKEWRYLFIPAGNFNAGSTFGQIAQKFERM